MKNIQVLLAGESWVSNSVHLKGWDFFFTNTYEVGISYLQAALVEAEIELTHIPNHLADTQFPNTYDALLPYDVVILSDIGPHWCPEKFATWSGYARLWVQAVQWLANQR